MEMIRTFVAVPLPAPIIRALERTQGRLADQVPPRSVRWVTTSGIHLTLKFIGDTPASHISGIDQALSVVARHAPPCRLTIEGVGCFPDTQRPRVVWIGVREPSGRLAALQASIEEALEPLGYKPERRGFTPHLTLGRVNQRMGRGIAAQIGDAVERADIGVLGQVECDGFALIQSVLKPTGAVYTTLASYILERTP